jgi:hypothetical protein
MLLGSDLSKVHVSKDGKVQLHRPTHWHWASVITVTLQRIFSQLHLCPLVKRAGIIANTLTFLLPMLHHWWSLSCRLEAMSG